MGDTGTVKETHELTIFADAKVWIEITEAGDAAIFFRHNDNNQFGTVSFDAENWAEVNAFWDRIMRSDETPSLQTPSSERR